MDSDDLFDLFDDECKQKEPDDAEAQKSSPQGAAAASEEGPQRTGSTQNNSEPYSEPQGASAVPAQQLFTRRATIDDPSCVLCVQRRAKTIGPPASSMLRTEMRTTTTILASRSPISTAIRSVHCLSCPLGAF